MKTVLLSLLVVSFPFASQARYLVIVCPTTSFELEDRSVESLSKGSIVTNDAAGISRSDPTKVSKWAQSYMGELVVTDRHGNTGLVPKHCVRPLEAVAKKRSVESLLCIQWNKTKRFEALMSDVESLYTDFVIAQAELFGLLRTYFDRFGPEAFNKIKCISELRKTELYLKEFK